jgi:hypothetical protein
MEVAAVSANILGCVDVKKPNDCLPYRLMIKDVKYD